MDENDIEVSGIFSQNEDSQEYQEPIRNPQNTPVDPSMTEENTLSGIFASLNLSDQTLSPSTSTATSQDRSSSLRRNLFEDYSSTTSEGYTDDSLPLFRKRRRNRMCRTQEWKKRRLEIREIEERRRRKKRRDYEFRRTQSLAGSTTSLELSPRSNLLFPNSDPDSEDLSSDFPSSSSTPFLLLYNRTSTSVRQSSIKNRRKLRPKRTRKVTFDLPPVVPINIDPDQTMSDDSDGVDNACAARYVPPSTFAVPPKTADEKNDGFFPRTEHETSDS